MPLRPISSAEAIVEGLPTEYLSGHDCTAKTAERLRTMGAEVDKSLAGHRRRVGDIEAELKLRLRQIAAELAKQQSQECTACPAVRTELEYVQQAWEDSQLESRVREEKMCQLEQEQAQLQQTLETTQAAHAEVAALLQTAENRILELEAQTPQADELVARQAELEHGAPQTTEASPHADVDVRQELEDLQCRYDMAIDDVHQLKQENQQLQEQLAAESPAAPASPIVGDDWQAQKSRLLAELAAEEQGSMNPERRQEVVAIEDTIALTDRLIAQKDQQIADLQAALAREPESQPQPEPAALTEALKKEIREEIFAEDQLIPQERKRLEAMQQEWQEKLREAELEISRERAKLAREHLALQEKISKQLAAQADVEEGKPRRRWLSALGLGEDEEEG